jgi:hypothetical protein
MERNGMESDQLRSNQIGSVIDVRLNGAVVDVVLEVSSAGILEQCQLSIRTIVNAGVFSLRRSYQCSISEPVPTYDAMRCDAIDPAMQCCVVISTGVYIESGR